MPNWCNNGITLRHADPAMIDRAVKGKDGLLMEFIPTPQELLDTVAGFLGEDQRAAHEAQQRANLEKYGAKNWYDFCTARWSTKWDVGGNGEQADVHPDGTVMTASFDSAWAPPIGVYEALVEQGYTVRAYYYEPGMCFAGVWDNGVDECYSDWGDSQGAKDTLPEELDEFFAISESQAEYEEEERMEEELYAFVKEGAEARQESSE